MRLRQRQQRTAPRASGSDPKIETEKLSRIELTTVPLTRLDTQAEKVGAMPIQEGTTRRY